MAQSNRAFPGTIDRGSAARLKFLEVWEAIDTLNSGPTAPSVTWPFMWWADTSANRLRQRNAGNSAWIDVMPLGVALDDRYARLAVTNSFTAPQQVAQQLAVARIDSVNEGGRVVLNRASDDAAAYQIQPFGGGASPVLRIVRLFGTPAQIAAFDANGRLHLAADATASDQAVRKGQLDAAIAALPAPSVTVSATATVTSAVGQVDLTLPDGPSMFLLLISGLVPSAAAQLWLRTSADGTTFAAGGSDYSDNIGTGSAIRLGAVAGNLSLSANSVFDALLLISPGVSSALPFRIHGTTFGIGHDGPAISPVSGGRAANGRQVAIRLLMNSGNINRATIRLLGVA